MEVRGAPSRIVVRALTADAGTGAITADDWREGRSAPEDDDRLRLPSAKDFIYKYVGVGEERFTMTHRKRVDAANGNLVRNVECRVTVLVGRVATQRRRLRELQQLRPRVGAQKHELVTEPMFKFRLQRVVRLGHVLRVERNRPPRLIRSTGLDAPWAGQRVVEVVA